MSNELKIYKLDSIPATLEPSALYFVRTGVSNLVNIYLTDKESNIIYRNHDSSDISNITMAILNALKNQPGGIAGIDDDGLIIGSILGNSGTTDKLKIPIKINGVDFDGSQDITIPSGAITEPIIITTLDNSHPLVEGLKLFRKKIASRNMFSFINDKGREQIPQPLLGRNNIGLYLPGGNSADIPAQIGMPPIVITGAITARNIEFNNILTASKRLGIISGNNAGAVCGYRVASAQYKVGSNSNLGGFFMIHRFGISDLILIPNSRMFVGMRSSIAAADNTSPASFTNSIGIGHDIDNSTLRIYYGGLASQQPIDLGINFPVTTNTDLYELALYSPINEIGNIYWQVTRINTGHIAEGVISDITGIMIPSSNVLLTSINSFRTNNTTGARVALDLISHYIETEY